MKKSTFVGQHLAYSTECWLRCEFIYGWQIKGDIVSWRASWPEHARSAFHFNEKLCRNKPFQNILVMLSLNTITDIPKVKEEKAVSMLDAGL
jgi:hypothetical protein